MYEAFDVHEEDGVEECVRGGMAKAADISWALLLFWNRSSRSSVSNFDSVKGEEEVAREDELESW